MDRNQTKKQFNVPSPEMLNTKIERNGKATRINIIIFRCSNNMRESIHNRYLV
jgi:hypothetical protein